VASWILVYGTLYRRTGATAAALLALVRWTLGLLNYASAGLAPAILHYAAKSTPQHTEPNTHRFPLRSIFTTGVTLSWSGALIGGLALTLWCLTQGQSRQIAPLVALFGAGMLIDVAADAWGAIIQSQSKIRTDYQCQTSLEITWAVLATLGLFQHAHLNLSWQTIVGGSYLLAAIASAIPRALIATKLIPPLDPNASRESITRPLLAFGILVVLSQIAEFLYAPTDFLLIRWLIDLDTVAIYAPAVQIDVGIWLLIGGLSTALLPLSAKQFSQRNFQQLRKYYLQGTAITLILLLIASALAWLAAPAIFKLWLGDKMRGTQKILPLVLISTVIGGSAAPARSILLATGHVKPFTLSVLIAGIGNVILSYTFVVHAHLGLKGIILGTIIVVIVRCALWMPWYTLRSLRKLAS
jgi:O-antigen/teichoic acid export membrane protein